MSITDEEFEEIRKIMFAKTGARLKDTKRPLVYARLRKRVEELGCKTFGDYIKKLIPSNISEMEFFVNALTTNETFFFRHTNQFNYLYEHILPEQIAEGKRKIEIWSGASSTGEEPYSISILMTEFAKKHPVDFKIFASDINTEVIAEAKEAIYDERAVKEVPDSLKERYFTVSKDSRYGTMYKVSDVIKKKVEFFQHNLQTTSSMNQVDIIFLRNVLIYFERDIKEKVVNLLEPCLKPKGYFFISLSENLNDIHTGLKLVGSGIFRKP